MKITNDLEMKSWLDENLVDKNLGAQITGQSIKAFEQSVRLGKIIPFFEIDGVSSSKIRLYKKSDLKEYALNKRK